jgi:DNA-binding HxlR family transcriptional regulator
MVAETPTQNGTEAACTTDLALDLMTTKWTGLVFYALKGETLRFNHPPPRHSLGLPEDADPETLREMERNGLVNRTVYPFVPPIVEYALTPLGQTLVEPMEALRRWATTHAPDVDRARVLFDESRIDDPDPARPAVNPARFRQPDGVTASGTIERAAGRCLATNRHPEPPDPAAVPSGLHSK